MSQQIVGGGNVALAISDATVVAIGPSSPSTVTSSTTTLGPVTTTGSPAGSGPVRQRRSGRSKDRRYSLPARVNVLLFNGQPTQISDQLANQKTSATQPTMNTGSSLDSNRGPREEPASTSSPSNRFPSLGAIPEDTETLSDHESNIEDVTQEVTNNDDEIVVVDPAPDGGYGWVIVFASFCCSLIVDGISYTFGLFFNHFVTHFGASKGKTALAGSLLSGCYMSAGPIVSALTNKYGCRAVTIAGSVVSCIAFLLAAVSPDINFLLVTYGIMGGIGFGLIYLPAIVSVGYYFTTKRAFATGIAVCGSGVGAFLFAPLCQLALTYYDWRGVLVIQAGIALNCAVFGALMRPLNVEVETVGDKGTSDQQEDVVDETRLLLENCGADLHELNRPLNREPGVQSVSDLNRVQHRNSLVPLMELVGRQTEEDEAGLTKKDGTVLNDSAISLSGDNSSPLEPLTSLRTSSNSGTGLSVAPWPPRRSSFQGRYVGKRTISDCTPPPLHVILSSNPGMVRRKSSVGGGTSQSIMVRPLSKKDIFYSGSTNSLHKRSSIVGGSKPSLADHRQSVVSIPAKDLIDRMVQKGSISRKTSTIVAPIASSGSAGQETKKKKDKKDSLISSSILRDMIDFSLIYESPSFALLALSNVFGMMGFYIPFVYIIQHLRTQVMDGDDFVSPEKAAYVLSAIGISNTLGRIIFGIITDHVTNPEKNSPITALFINNVCVMVAGITVTLIPWFVSYWGVFINCIVFGIFISAYISLTSIIIVDLVGLAKLTNGYGLINMCRGIAAMLGPPLAGTIYDFTGSFDLTFYAAGLLLIMSSVVSFFIPEQLKWKRRS